MTRTLEEVAESVLRLMQTNALYGPGLSSDLMRELGSALSRAKAPEDPLWDDEDEPLALSLAAYERACLRRTLRRTAGDAKAAAKLLGIGKSTVYRLLHKHGLSQGLRGHRPIREEKSDKFDTVLADGVRLTRDNA